MCVCTPDWAGSGGTSAPDGCCRLQAAGSGGAETAELRGMTALQRSPHETCSLAPQCPDEPSDATESDRSEIKQL